MAEFEKRAWWNLCVVAATVMVFVVLWMVTRIFAASMAAFSILALSAFPFFRLRQPASDERDREIDRKSMLVSMNVFWILLVVSSVGMGFALGWDTMVQVPVRAFSQIIWGGWLVILATRSAVSIRMYRAG